MIKQLDYGISHQEFKNSEKPYSELSVQFILTLNLKMV